MNNYQILGLKGTETKDEIKSKFRSLSKQLHPDVNGGDASKTKKFVEVLKAYNELMEGVTGETKQQSYQSSSSTSGRYNNDYWGDFARDFNKQYKNKKAEYRFIDIKKTKEGDYIIIFFMSGVKKVKICGKNGDRVASYDVDEGTSNYNLRLSAEDAKLAKYHFEISLHDRFGNYATVTYKVKKPKDPFTELFENVILNLPKLLIILFIIYFIFIMVIN